MPLYQSQGNDGYFLIRPLPLFVLWLSSMMRKLKTDSLFVLLPGVRWHSPNKEVMEVDLRIARFIAKPLLHLFGYRSKQKSDTHLLIKNREYRSKKAEYKNADWF
jgi:hypothetical protein